MPSTSSSSCSALFAIIDGTTPGGGGGGGHDKKQMASLAIFVRKSTLHLHDQGVKKRNSYSVLVTIDLTGTNIITYNIIFGIKNG